MAEGIISRKGGSAFTTNAVIRSASVSQGNTIAPGNVITLSQNNTNTVESYIPNTTSNVYKRKILKINETRVLYAYSTQSESYYTNFQIVDLATNKTMTAGGNVVDIINSFSSIRQNDIVALNDGRFLILGIENGGPTTQMISYRFLTLSGTTLSVTTPLYFGSTSSQERLTTTSTVNSIRAEVINNNQVLVHYVNVSSHNTARILTISGNTITANLPFVLNTTFGTHRIDLNRISETKFVVSYVNTSNNYPYVQILVLSGTAPNYDTVTMGTAYIPHSQTYYSTKVINYTKDGTTRVVFSGYAYNSGYHYLWWYSVSGASLIYETNNNLAGAGTTSYTPYASDNMNIDIKFLYADRFVVAANWRDSNNYPYVALYIYDHFSQVYGSSQYFAPYTTNHHMNGIDLMYLNQNNFILSFTHFNSSYYLPMLRFVYNTDHLVAANTSALTSIRGFALTGGTQDQLIDVYTIGVALT